MKRLGILGGGQLGRMLIQAAINYNFTTKVLDPDAAAPCQSICNEFVHGSFADYDTVYQFGKDVDVLTVEIEHVNVAALKQLQSEGVAIFPQPEVIELIQDKGLQKQFYQEHGIPTAAFQLCDQLSVVEQYAGPFPVIQKLRKLGYDGKGVVKINSNKEYSQAFKDPSLLEEYIPFHKELAVIVARNERGDIVTYPTVEMKFHPEVNLVEWLLAPARVHPTVDEQARDIAMKVAEALKMVGVLAVELFLTADGELLVNEIAPRPHNSGHHTIEANMTSQYDQHLRAICNWPLGDTTARSAAVMVNLLGQPGYTGLAKYENLRQVLAEPNVYVHLYGKQQTKPFRKMGHLTVVDEDADVALNKAKAVQRQLRIIA